VVENSVLQRQHIDDAQQSDEGNQFSQDLRADISMGGECTELIGRITAVSFLQRKYSPTAGRNWAVPRRAL
jgi:hypothetical protein